MTAYEDWLRDYPARALRLMRDATPLAQASNLEVTLLLSIGSLLLIAPYERLRLRPKEARRGLTHVDKDRDKPENQGVVGILDELFGSDEQGAKFVEAVQFWGADGVSGTWQGGHLGENDPVLLDSWADASGLRLDNEGGWPIPHDWSFTLAFSTMRNALAHGSVRTHYRWGSKMKTIDKLVFTSKSGDDLASLTEHRFLALSDAHEGSPVQKYRFVATTPADWKDFLTRWASILKEAGPMAIPEAA